MRTQDMIPELSYPLFAEKGFNRVTMKDICEKTGLSRGGLYSHFSATDRVFEAILERINQKDAMCFDHDIAEGVPAEMILNRALDLMEYDYAYKGIRMWSRIIEITPEISGSVTGYLRRQLTGGRTCKED